MLDKRLVPISFAQGIDSKTDAKQVVPGKLLELENGVFYQTRSIKKRDGFDALPLTTITGGTITEGSGLSTFKGSLVEYSGSAVNGYVEHADKFSTYAGTISPVDFSTRSAVQSASIYSAADSNYDASSGLVCSAFFRETSFGFATGLYYTVYEKSTGTVVVGEGTVTTAAVSFFKTLFLGSKFYIIYLESGGTTIRYKTVDTATPASISASSDIVVNAFSGTSPFDAAAFNSKIYLAYYSSNATRSVGHLTFVSGGSPSSVSYLTQRASNCVCVFTDPNNNLWVGVGDDTNGVKGWAYNSALSSLVVPVTTASLGTTSARISGIFETGSSPIRGQYFVEFNSPVSANFNITYNFSLTASAVSALVAMSRNLGIAGKPFYFSGSIYVFMAFRSTIQPTFFLMKHVPGGTAVAVAKVASQIGGTIFWNSFFGHVPEVWADGATAFGVAYQQVNESYTTLVLGVPPLVTIPVWGIQVGEFDFDAVTRTLEIANGIYSFGAIASVFDGSVVAEQGFNYYPEVIAFGADTGGGSVATGTYSYVATYEWTDAQGQIHRSSPSQPFSHTVAAGPKTVNMTVSNLNVTQKSKVRIGLYRTQNAGTVYYFVNAYAMTANTDTTTISDVINDAQLVSQGLLYTSNGEVENIPLPAPLTMGSYKNRMIAVPSEATSSFWYSKEVSPGFPAEFSDLFVQNIDQKGGGITAVTQMDDKLCLFKSGSIFVMTGDGPAPSGANNDFTPAQEIASDSGCINDRSLVLMPMGVMYQSAKGIYLLGRNLQVSYIGADVEAYNNNVITSAKLYPKRNQVIFTLDSGVALVYDYAFQQWSVFTGIDAVGLTVYEDKIAYVKADGTVMLETPGVYTDNGTGYSLKLKTSWLSFAGLQGFQRVYDVLLLGDYKSTHTLQIEASHDFIDVTDQTANIVGTSTPPYQYRLDFKKQKCEAVQLTIQDVTPTGESFEISSMAFEVGMKRGANKLSQSRNYG